MLVEGDSAYMTMREFGELLEYSCSLPTGTTAGKRWKRGWPYVEPRISWLMGEYGQAIGDSVPIIWRSIYIQVGTVPSDSQQSIHRDDSDANS